MKALEYTLNDTAAYGLYNGLNETEIERIVHEVCASKNVSLYEFEDALDRDILFAIKRQLNEDLEIKAEALNTYEPQPLDNGWRDEVKQAYYASLANKSWLGRGAVPHELILSKVNALIDEAIEQARPVRIKAAQRVIETAERQKKGIPFVSEARLMERKYNEGMNEGGGGYVPHIVDRDEYEQAKATLQRLLEG